MLNKLLLFFIATILFHHSSLIAEEENIFTISGFGSIGGAYQDNDALLYRTSTTSRKGAKDDFSFATDSRIGLQLDGKVTDNLSVTIQGMIDNLDSDGGDAKIEWANVKYNFTNNFFVRAGRMRLPAFMHSDILNVSYAYPWLRLPTEVYATFPISNYDGVELDYLYLGNGCSFALQLLYGQTKNGVYANSSSEVRTSFKFDDILGITGTLNIENLKIRASYIQLGGTIEDKYMEKLSQALNQVGESELSKKLSIENEKFNFHGLGFTYDYKNIFITGEYTYITTSSVFEDISAGYASLGYRINKFLPYIIYSESSQNQTMENTLPSIASLASLSTGVDHFIRNLAYAQKTSSVGVRYDFLDSASLKLQYDYISFDENDGSIYIREYPTGNSVNVFSVLVDFVF